MSLVFLNISDSSLPQFLNKFPVPVLQGFDALWVRLDQICYLSWWDVVRNIESNGTTLVNYSYLADGTKLSADSSLTLESAGNKVAEGQVIGKSGVSGNAKNLTGENQRLHFELRIQKENAIGLTGKKDPNEIVDTKFYSRNPDVKPQTDIGIIKVSKDGKEEIMDTY